MSDVPPLSDEPGGGDCEYVLPSDEQTWDPYYLARAKGSVLRVAAASPGVTDHLNCK